MVDKTDHFIESQGVIDRDKCRLSLYHYSVNNDKAEIRGLVIFSHLIIDQRDPLTTVACTCQSDEGYIINGSCIIII